MMSRSRKSPPDFTFDNLEERGRLQFFYHSPSSSLPVRDVLGEQGHGRKTEPHLEERAENYCNECLQKQSIVPFLKSHEKYLFLYTRCKSKASEVEKFRNRPFVVGYIVKERALHRSKKAKEWWAVQGEMRLYSFEDGYPLQDLIGPVRIRGFKKLNSRQSARILDRFSQKRNIYLRCLRELERLKKGRPSSNRRCK